MELGAEPLTSVCHVVLKRHRVASTKLEDIANANRTMLDQDDFLN